MSMRPEVDRWAWSTTARFASAVVAAAEEMRGRRVANRRKLRPMSVEMQKAKKKKKKMAALRVAESKTQSLAWCSCAPRRLEDAHLGRRVSEATATTTVGEAALREAVVAAAAAAAAAAPSQRPGASELRLFRPAAH
jgi:hypothetical protein